MQQDRLDGWMVRQIENADMAKETMIQLPIPKHSSLVPLSTRGSRPPPRTTHRSVTAIAGQGICSILPPQSPRSAPNSRNPTELFDSDESIEKKWRAQFHDLRKPCIEGDHVDRTKVLHNMMKKTLHDDEQSPLFLWGLPREHILEFIRQSVLPSSWIHPSRRPVSEWEAVTNEEDEVAQVRRAVAEVLATASSKSPKKVSSPRAPSSPRSPLKSPDGASSPRRRAQSLVTSPSSPRSTQITPRSEERIQRFIAELRADPTLWAAFQNEVEQIQQQYRQKNHTGDKIRENKERAKSPRSPDEHELKKKQTAERMERTHRHREQIIQLEDEKLAAKREAYLRKVNPDRQLPASELEQTPRYRRRKAWLHVVSFAAISHHWHQELVQTKNLMAMAKVEGVAACIIQKIWRKWKWQHASKHTVVVYTWLRKCLWKLLLRVRCRRKARNAALLRLFMQDQYSQSHAKKNFTRVMIQWRGKVIRAQKAGMSFINCNRARLQALSIWWENVDHERQRTERQHNMDERRLTARKDSSSGSAPGSAGAHRSRAGSVAILGGMDEKLANMQMLITPVELQRLQQTSAQVVKIPKSIKWQLLTEFLTESRKEFRRKLQAYKEEILCASYARLVIHF
ncbi:hypothetical protein PPTG_11870 [Phytophthora nicotianae INRA-310]|uniref:Uncharacterized protein n=1 Tax=Phytophthora nicotianae (strain INRA-310) TaxID=761204 RepID=W2Q9D1_PHYN3|nr:hypothetical protein PPTG_11870 [Phytophthora nicotianae INRA-310]ETN09481.1 hypothetical protein PPTG_11870 [Phytophthora nicotianae INRA-310]